MAWDIDGVVDVVNNLGITQPVTSSTPLHREVPLKPDEFLGMLTKPEDLVAMLAKPGEFIASAYDFAEQLLTSHAEYAEGMTEAIKPLLGGTKSAAAKKDDSK